MRVVALLSLLTAGTAEAAPRIESLAVRADNTKATEVVISVSIERPTPLDLNCDAVIDPGDGGKFMMTWGIGDRRTKTARYDYKKAGTYRLRVSGTGKDACVGAKEATVSVGAGQARPAASSATPRCPSGWTLVDDSVKGVEKEVGMGWDALDDVGKKLLMDGGGEAIKLSSAEDAKFRKAGDQVTEARLKELEGKGLPARQAFTLIKSLSEKHAKDSRNFWK